MTTTEIIMARYYNGAIDVRLSDEAYADRRWLDPPDMKMDARRRLDQWSLSAELQQVGYVEFPEGDIVIYPEYTRRPFTDPEFDFGGGL